MDDFLEIKKSKINIIHFFLSLDKFIGMRKKRKEPLGRVAMLVNRPETYTHTYQLSCVSDHSGIIRVQRPLDQARSQYVCAIGLDAVSIPWTMDNVFSDVNDHLYFSEGTNKYFRAKIPVGSCDIRTLCANIMVAMNGAVEHDPFQQSTSRPVDKYVATYNEDGRVFVKNVTKNTNLQVHAPSSGHRCICNTYSWTANTKILRLSLQDDLHGLVDGEIVLSVIGVPELSHGPIGRIVSTNTNDGNATTIHVQTYITYWSDDRPETPVPLVSRVLRNVVVESSHANVFDSLVNISTSHKLQRTRVVSAHETNAYGERLLLLDERIPLDADDVLRIGTTDYPVISSGCSVQVSNGVASGVYAPVLRENPYAVVVQVPPNAPPISADVQAIVPNVFWSANKIDVMPRGVHVHCNVNSVGDVGNVLVAGDFASRYLASLRLKDAVKNDMVNYSSNDLDRFDHAIPFHRSIRGLVDITLQLHSWNNTPVKLYGVRWDCLLRVTVSESSKV
jgi:hypothetical protein